MNTVYSATQIVDKTLFAKKPVRLYRTPGDEASFIRVVPQGQQVGKVFSYIIREGKLYWQFEEPGLSGPRAYYALHEEGRFDLNALTQQGALSVQEERELAEKRDQEEQNPIAALFDGVGDSLANIGGAFASTTNALKWIMPAILVVIAIILIIYIAKTFKLVTP